MDKCPICFNDVSTYGQAGYSGYTDDPMKSPNHFIPALRGTTLLRARHITELRTKYNEYETSVGISPTTTWSEIDPNKFMCRVQYINELRECMEGILDKLGISLSDYLSMDESGVPSLGITDWLNGHRLAKTIPVRAMHIEELRKAVPMKAYDTLNMAPYGVNYPALANKSTESESKYFHKTVQPADYQIWELMHPDGTALYYSPEEGKFYAFFTDMSMDFSNESPMVSWCDGTNIDFVNWKGVIADGDYEAHTIRFNPALPFSGYHADQLTEGIWSLSIDSDDTDYLMYTIEIFESRGRQNCVSRYKFPKIRYLGLSDGTPDQTFNLSSFDIQLPLIAESEIIEVDGTSWTRVANFTASTASSTHYTINNSTGIVTFGDGTHGKIPPSGSAISAFMTLKGGGVWKFDKVVGVAGLRDWYFRIIAKDGKVWWYYKRNAFEEARITNLNCQSVIGKIVYSQSTGYTGNILSAYWQVSGQHSLIGSGGAIASGPYYSGTLDGAARFSSQAGRPTGTVYVDSPSAWSVSFTAPSQTLWMPNAICRYISNDKIVYENPAMFPPVTSSESVGYGYEQWQINKWVFIEQKSNWVRITFDTKLTEGSYIFRPGSGIYCIELFDLTSGGDTIDILSTMTQAYSGNEIWWTKTVGNIYYEVRARNSSGGGGYTYITRSETGISDRPWGRFRFGMKYYVSGYTSTLGDTVPSYYYENKISSLVT